MTRLTEKELAAALSTHEVISDTGDTGGANMRKTKEHKALIKAQDKRCGPLVIVLYGERPQSLNNWYSGQHWTKRKREASRVHSLVRAQLGGCKTFTTPVCITVTAYFKSRPQDASNIVAKLYEDALIGYVLIDDSPQYVRSMTTESRIDRINPRVEIRVMEDGQ